jgi:N-formylglutamate deformylase
VSRFGAMPLVFDSPHSGFEFPSDFNPVASPAEIRTSWDGYVDELYNRVPSAGATLLAARFPRAYIDTNRAGNDVDPELLATPWPEPVELSEHSSRGMGLIRRLALPGVPMYDRRLTVAEVQHRIQHYYAPYRKALDEIIERVWRRHGAVWHFNCHSMKSRGNAMNRDQGAARPDLVISDRDGTTAGPGLADWVAEHFRSRGYRVNVNHPYRGADIVRSVGQPHRRRFSLQIELNRSRYMDEATGERNDRFDHWQSELTEFAHVMVLKVRDDLARGLVP